MSRRSRVSALLSLALVSGAAFAADPITMEISPAFEGYSPSYGTVPIAVELHNDGADARGILRITGDNYNMDFPVELPRGADKRLLTFPAVDYAGLRYLLMTNRGNILRNYQLPSVATEGTATTLLISDTSGELAFLRGADAGKRAPAPGAPVYPGNSGASSIQDAYTQPIQAPSRAVGYANIAVVMLGTGAERLNEDQIQALKLYALAGGTLVFVGGASSPVLGDARWQDVLPAHDFRVATLPASTVLEQIGGYQAPEVSVMSGTPVAGAAVRREGSVLLTAERQYGVGKIVYLAFNPFEAPLSKWEGRRAAVNKAIRALDASRTQTFLSSYSASTSNPAFSSTAYVPGTTPPPGTGGSSVQDDPFSTKLPPTERVFFLLGAYFIVVVPINFFVLKKLRRGELAWFTAPLISLGFASAFFVSAQDLYSARMSTATQGLLIGQEGLDEGMFIGKSQLFIPRGGSYDLKMQGVDSLGVTPANQYYYGREDQDTSELNPIDVGEVRIPEMQANNLSFREVEYRQKLPVGRWFSISLSPSADGSKRTCRVRNESPYPLQQSTVYVGDVSYNLGTVEAGSSKSIEIMTNVPANDDPAKASGLQQFLTRNRAIAVEGMLRGLRPGPQLGAQVDDRSSIRLAFVAQEALGPK